MSDFGKAKAEHRRIREMLSVYIDGELSPRDRAKVEEHLAECADCTWELETLRQTVDLLVELPKVPVPRAFTIRETDRPRRVSLFQTRWVYTYLKGATALAAALLILVLAGDALFQLQRAVTGLAPAMAPAKEVAAPATAPTVVAMQKAPETSPPEEGLDEAEVTTYAEGTPSPLPHEEKAFGAAPSPTVPAAESEAPMTRAGAAATPPTTSAPLVGRAEATSTPLPTAVIEAPAEKVSEAPPAPAAAPMVVPQPQMTATQTPAALSAPTRATPLATPVPLATATSTATPVSVARAPTEVRPTEEKGALAGPSARPQGPRLTMLRVVEASLCLLVMVLITATLIVRRGRAI